MKTIEWSEEFRTGNSRLDEQNKALVELVNEMIESGEHDVDAETLSDILNRLMEYAMTHHKEEEAYMQQIGCADLPSQKARHETFKERISRFCLDAMKKKSNLHREVCEYLVDWLSSHVFSDDPQSFSFLKMTV